ncbi:MAG TPA: hypothetical protein VMV86_03330 [Methanosarcinales archaeon]|nr:hypothetical protein [Methanosarcinales archaeon]
MAEDISKIEVADRVLQQRDREIKVKTIWSTVKIIILSLILLAAGGAVFQGYHWFTSKFDAQAAQNALLLEENRKYQKITTDLNGKIVELTNQVRAGTSVVTSGSSEWKDELAKLKKENAEVLALIKKNGEDIKNVGTIAAKANENLSLELRKISDHTYKAGTGDPNEQYFKKIMMKEKNAKGEVIEIPIGWSIFYPNKPAEEQWKTGVYPIEFKTKVIQSEQEDGQWNTYAEMWAENNKDKESIGKQLPLDVEMAEFKQLLIKDKKFFAWNPRVNLNADVGFGTGGEYVGAGISFSFMGYGRTKVDQTWQFIDLGVSTSGDKTWFRFSPVKYNLGEHVPFIKNTFVSPFVGMDIEGEFMGGVGISIPF